MDLQHIEQQRHQLEQQVSQLRDSLRRWQLWDAEYEGLKEELEAQPVTGDTLIELSTSYAGSLVNEQEIRDLTGLAKNTPRTRKQIIELIDHRLVYVTKNIETLSRQFYVAEGRLETFDFASSIASGENPRFDDDETAPAGDSLFEIVEELDDDDNIVKSEVRRPDLETVKILESITSQKEAVTQRSAASTEHDNDTRKPPRPPIRKKSVSFSADTKAAMLREPSPNADGRKSVSFAAKVAVAPAAAPPDNRSVSFAPQVQEIPPDDTKAGAVDLSNTAAQKDLQSSFAPGDTVYELNDDDQPATRHVVLPKNESPQDAEMRRQMLNYHLNEVGSVIAAMHVDDDDGDDHSDHTGSEYLDDLDTPYTTGTDDEDEDEFGRSKDSGLSEDYRQQMSALSARLLSNDVAPSTTHDLPLRSGRLATQTTNTTTGESKERSNSKKRVSFAEALDVASEPDPPAKHQKSAAPDDLDDEDDTPAGPILAETLVERPTKTADASAPSIEDADMLMSRRELATEYHRRRNDMVREQGGFAAQNDHHDDDQLYEERDGKVKKVSRFKAARLQG